MQIKGLTFERFLEMAKATWHVLIIIAGGGAWVIVTYMNLTTQVKANSESIVEMHRENKDEMDSVIKYLDQDRRAQRWMMKQFPAYKDGEVPDLPDLPRNSIEQEKAKPQSLAGRPLLTTEIPPEQSDRW